jgi:hypothetical protein
MVDVLADDTTAPFSGCLPKTGTLAFSGPNPNDDSLMSIPSNAVAFSIFTRLNTVDLANFIGVQKLTDPSGAVIYTPPNTAAEFFTLPIRYVATEAASTMLVPNAPSLTVMPGVYSVVIADEHFKDRTTTFYVKLGDAPVATGKVSLNFYVTDLSGACKQPAVTASNGASALAGDIGDIKQIFGQAGITVSEVTFHTSSAPNTIRVDTTNSLPDLDNELLAATTGQSTTVGLDIVLVRSITDANGQPGGVLGVAGGIPGSPVLGTPHSGAVVSIANDCGQTLLGPVASHEVAHTLGLFHSMEQAGQTDPLTDTQPDGSQNLMFWEENSGRHLTLQQGQVLRNDPKVRP